MTERPLHILQVNTSDIGGGAEKIAWDLFQACRARGLGSWLAVDSKHSDDPDVLLVPRVSNTDRSSKWTRGWLTIANRLSSLEGKVCGWWRVLSLLRIIARPGLLLEIQQGNEDFDFPGSWHVLDLLSERPDILHCHNLHGGYFDMRALPWLSQEVPTMLTLHDPWLLSGHCAYSFDCERWTTGCGHCPDLTIYPAVKRDATAYNWQRKENIYSSSRLYVATPSQWLMRKVERSILASAIEEARVIPNGVDFADFHPGDRREARAELGIPQDVKMLLFVGSTRSNSWKDYTTLEVAVKRVAERLPTERVVLICLGEEHQPQRIGQAEVHFVPYQKDPSTVARYFQAADVYVHAAKAEVWGLVITEALACGIPVVATAVGGIPEQVKDGVTGFLVASGDAEAMAKHILMLLTDEVLRQQFALNAAQDARERFDLNRQVDAYIEWYRMIDEHRAVGA
ncbi:MAG: glycosyltransferase [Anaerolineales bacterium]|nr:glycosyltransferase [Anaerolineales bacterium]